MNKIYYLKVLFLIFFFENLASQSSSVFDACYFKKENADPPIKVGKGFHINDVYKQTNSCFTSASCGTTHLKAQGTNQKATINLYYTRNEEQFNTLRNTGSSGKISFLNLFSMGAEQSESFRSKKFHQEERLIFVAKVDFGVYFFDNDLVLTPEAKNLILKSKTTEFVDKYGTHYISGVRRENNIWIILTKNSSANSTKKHNSSKAGITFKTPYKAKGSFELSDGEETEELLNSAEYSVSVEINGPQLKGDLMKSIQEILANSSKNKLNLIKNLLNNAISGISDPKHSNVSQYYYTPFALKGLKGVYWDDKKQTRLLRINEAAMHIFALKSQLDPLASFSGQSILLGEFDSEVPEYSKKRERKAELISSYKVQQPILKLHKQKLDTFLVLLEKDYAACSSIFCDMANCCNAFSYQDQMDEIIYKTQEQTSELESIIKNADGEAYEETVPECEKQNLSTITIISQSVNPYDLYDGNNNYLGTLTGGASVSYKVKPGTYAFKATQKSGYLLYATVNNREVMVTKPCEQLNVTIGYED